MALESRVVSLNFVSGLDQKTDPKLTTKLTTADNVVLRKNGTIEKRPGFVASGNWSVSANPVKVFPFRDGEFFTSDYATDTLQEMFTRGGSGFTLTTSNQQHALARVGSRIEKQELYYCSTIRTNPLLSDSGSVTLVDSAVFAKSSTQSGVVFSQILGLGSGSTAAYIYDLDTGARVLRASGVANASRVLSVSVTSATVLQLAYANTALNFLTWSVTGVSVGTSISIITATNPQLDAVSGISADPNSVFFAVKQNSSTGIIVGKHSALGGTSYTIINAGTTADIVTLATPAPGTDRLRLFWMRNTASNTGFMATYSVTLSEIQAPTTITIGVAGYGNGLITQLGAVENAGATAAYLMFTQSSTTSLPIYTAWNGEHSNTGVTVTGAGAFTNEGGFKSCGLAAKPFLVHDRPTAILVHSATAQQSFVVVQSLTEKLSVVGRCLFGLAGPNASSSYAQLPQVQKLDNDVYYTPLRRAVYFKSNGLSFTSNYGAELVRCDFSQTQSIPVARIAGSTYMGGGYLSQYDAGGIIESGFLSSAVIASVSTTTLGGSLGASSGSYGVVILKEFTDQVGKTHRGQPSLPVTFTTSTTTSQATIVFSDGPNLKSTLYRGGQIKYTAFRTTNGGSLYYRDAGSALSATYIASITALTLTLTVSDSVLSGGDVLYTQGGALPRWTPDSCESLWIHGNRLWCPDPSDDTILRYSNEVVEGEGVAFAQANIVRVPGSDRITSGESLDSSCVTFRARSLLIVGGSGPNDTGQDGTFSDAQMLYADIGCINQSNLCRFKDGIVFKSPDKGFYLLTRDLQLSFIGADVENYNSKTVVSSEVVALTEASGTVEECRFLCSDGTLLTYNYYNGQWTTATLAGCTDAVQTGGRYVVVNPTSTAANARVFQQSMTTYLDAFSNTSTTYQMTVETGFVKTADVQGFQRIWKVQGLGESMGGGRISVEVGYDYETAYNETYTFNMSSMTTPNYTGGAASIPQFDFVPARQKCQAIRFRIKDYPTENGAVMKITNLSLECGVKSGVFKLPAAKGA